MSNGSAAGESAGRQCNERGGAFFHGYNAPLSPTRPSNLVMRSLLFFVHLRAKRNIMQPTQIQFMEATVQTKRFWCPREERDDAQAQSKEPSVFGSIPHPTGIQLKAREGINDR